ncbi:hypothetical protein BJ742DRAFT_106915 [Cladochytrium replicatum]|nr:hypothetical protein BJ742DRAFT_106915 [Cladochytrium replicatum]
MAEPYISLNNLDIFLSSMDDFDPLQASSWLHGNDDNDGSSSQSEPNYQTPPLHPTSQSSSSASPQQLELPRLEPELDSSTQPVPQPSGDGASLSQDDSVPLISRRQRKRARESPTANEPQQQRIRRLESEVDESAMQIVDLTGEDDVASNTPPPPPPVDEADDDVLIVSESITIPARSNNMILNVRNFNDLFNEFARNNQVAAHRHLHSNRNRRSSRQPSQDHNQIDLLPHTVYGLLGMNPPSPQPPRVHLPLPTAIVNRNPSPPTESPFKCAICLGKPGEKTQLVSTTCGHVYCESCLKDAMKVQKKCPTCRKSLSSKNAVIRLYLN